jgi:pimeloyl-ACP methyl ester carboxylesterase
MGHSRGGHVCFRVAQRRPDLIARLILAEPGGELDASLDPDYTPSPWVMAGPIAAAAELIAKGDIDGGLEIFMTALQAPWNRLPAATKQLLRDNATTLIGDARDMRMPFSQSDAESIRTPTLFIGGANTRGLLPKVLHTLAAHVKGARTELIAATTHAMFEQAPQRFSEIVLDFLGD